jgi:hypothetical protein
MRAQSFATCLLALCGTLAFVVGGCGGIVDADANAELLQALGDTSITVFPAFVRDGEEQKYDTEAASAIADFVTQENLATVTVSDVEVAITSKWGMNQAKMFRGSAADFSTYVQGNSTGTDYALLPEYLIGGRGTPVGVHLYLVDAEGTVAYAFLTNSHHEVFTDVDPKTLDDCTTMVLNKLRADLTPGGAAEANKTDQTQQQRLDAMRAKGAAASLTIFPVVMPDIDAVHQDVADAVALLLEQAGMGNLETTDVVFRLPAGVDFERAAELFGKFVRQNPIETEYTLYVEFIGTPQSGPQEIRGVVVDKAGDCVWIDRQTPDDPDFKRIKPDCPLACCYLFSERLRTQLGLTEADRDETSQGKFARLWACKSGTPSGDERTAMEDRLAIMRAAGANARLAVFPVRLSGDEVSSDDATRLAKLLGEQGLCEAAALETPLRIALQPSRNEQKLLWDLARAFRDHVEQNPPDADYVLYADYMIGSRTGEVGAVHFVVCDRAGEWVIVDFQNDHHADFNTIGPQTCQDCSRLVAKRLAGYLR